MTFGYFEMQGSILHRAPDKKKSHAAERKSTNYCLCEKSNSGHRPKEEPSTAKVKSNAAASGKLSSETCTDYSKVFLTIGHKFARRKLQDNLSTGPKVALVKRLQPLRKRKTFP